MCTYNDHKFFVTHKLNIVAIKQHIRAIEVDITEEESLCRFDDLYCHGVLQLGHCTYLIEKDNRIKQSIIY